MYLLFDIGGTKTRVAVSHDGYVYNEPVVYPTPQDFEEGMVRLEETAVALGQGGIKAVCGGVAGTFDREKTRLARSSRLEGWAGQPIKERLEAAFGAPVFLENDAALVGLGEATAGAGKNGRIVAYLTISTGVGGARIVDGRIDRHTFGLEPGHQIIRPEGETCPGCGGRGHLEGLISGTAIERKHNKKPADIRDELVWEEAARQLAYGLHNTLAFWSPDTVVLGGSMMKEVGIPLERVKRHLEQVSEIYPELPVLAKATLGDFGGIEGALAHLRSQGAVA